MKNGSSGGSSLLLLFAVLALGAVFLIRSQRRRTRQAAQATAALEPGTRVLTRAGMIASVVAVEGGELLLEVAPGVVCRFVAGAVARVLDPPPGSTTSGDDPGEQAG